MDSRSSVSYTHLDVYKRQANQWDLRPVSNINAIAAMINEAESRSASVCERCGIAGTLFRDGYWRTHCELCEARYQKELIND